MKAAAILALLCFPLCSPVLAEDCSDFEIAVADLWRRAVAFQETVAFREFGFSKAGPTGGWLDDFKRLNGANDNSLRFLQTYGFAVGDIYMVADEYRTKGRLDDFFADLSASFVQLDRCQ